MKSIKTILLSTLFCSVAISCTDQEDDLVIQDQLLTEIPDDFKKIMIESTELKGEIYYFNQNKAKIAGLPITYIEKMKTDIENLNFSLEEARLEENHEIELVDPATLDVDKLIEDYNEKIDLEEQTGKLADITGDLSTRNTSVNEKWFFNPDKTHCQFTYMQRVAMTATHTLGTRAQGGWKYVTRVGFLVGISYKTTLTFDASNTTCRVSYRTGDGRGGFCGYRAFRQ